MRMVPPCSRTRSVNVPPVSTPTNSSAMPVFSPCCLALYYYHCPLNAKTLDLFGFPLYNPSRRERPGLRRNIDPLEDTELVKGDELFSPGLWQEEQCD